MCRHLESTSQMIIWKKEKKNKEKAAFSSELSMQISATG